MAYLLSNDTARWLDSQRRRGDLVGTPRHGQVLPAGQLNGDVSVCYITGGDPLHGYSAAAYPSMAAMRGDTEEGHPHGRPTTIFPCEIGLDAFLPEGTIVLCHAVQCRVTGGSENNT